MGFLSWLFGEQKEVGKIPNPAEHGFTPGHDFHTKLVGVTRRNDDGSERQEIISQCELGERLFLKRESDNPKDSNAIAAVRASYEMLGYLSAERAKSLAADMDAGSIVTAEISDITGGSRAKPKFGVNILVTYWDDPKEDG